MRTLVAALLLACSAAHAGTFTVSITNPSLSLVDLDSSDGVASTLTLSPGSSLADWNTPYSFGGEFWADYSSIPASPGLYLTGVLGAHSAIDWSGSMVVDTKFLSTGTNDERMLLLGGVAGSTENGSISQIDFPPYYRTGNVHDVESLSIFLRNDNDEATPFSLVMAFTPLTYSDVARPVPEPSTYLMMLGGLALIPLARRKAKARRG